MTSRAEAHRRDPRTLYLCPLMCPRAGAQGGQSSAVVQTFLPRYTLSGPPTLPECPHRGLLAPGEAVSSPGQQEKPIKKPLKSRVRAVPCTGRQGGDRDSAGQGLYVQFLEKGVREMTGGPSSYRHILFLWKTNLIPDGEASSRHPLGVSGGLSVSPIGSAPFAQCPEWPPSLPAPPWKVEFHLNHTLPFQGEAASMGLPTSEMQADFYPQPKLGPDYDPHGLSGSRGGDSCHLEMPLRTDRSEVLHHCVFLGSRLCWQLRGQNSLGRLGELSPGSASE